MATAMENIASDYKDLLEDSTDTVVSKWLFMDNIITFPALMIAYLLFCTKIGPWYMRDKRPYNLSNVIKIYNFIQVIISAYLVYQAGTRMFFYDFDFKCQYTPPDSPFYYWETKVSYAYFIAKLTELLDTVFFVLRKSYRQVTFLHLFHHTIMPCACWLFIRSYPGGNAGVMGFLNSLVHVVMYSYYLLSSYEEKYKNSLWWKKYVTIMQLVQFVIVGAHSLNSLFYECGYPNYIKVMMAAQAVFFFKMFFDFYRRTYMNKRTGKSINGNSSGLHKNEEIKSH